MPNIVPIDKPGSISAHREPPKASSNLKSVRGASAKIPSRKQLLSSRVRVGPRPGVRPKPGNHIKHNSSKAQAVEIRKVAPVRKVVTGQSGNHLRAKLSSNLTITKPIGNEAKVGDKRSHAEVSGSKVGSAKATTAQVTESPKPKKTKIDSVGHNVDRPNKAMDNRKHEDIVTALEFADWCFKADAAGFILSHEIKMQICSNLTVPGSTTEEYMTNLMSSQKFQEVAKRAFRIFKGEEPVDDAVIVTFVVADSTNPDGPTSKAWVTAQLVACLAPEMDFKWRKTGIYRGYKRLLRYLQGCRNDEYAFDPDLGTVLLRKARAGEGVKTLNPLKPTTESTNHTSVKTKPLEQAPEAIDQSEHLKQSSNIKSLPTHLRKDKATNASVASGPPREKVLE
ncbi:hypothetical protein CkaCkLH20_09320 [Colletotrichum karsti]|uniref:Uncharacterized protein n=1 Tax=Colletotrichum karsti TaxID=1095194 RepID=A0A9P6HZS1_9PEZI|nr:uncharacterized protein CkaCkLH20_09320 [Colletotrichum karsti]KAF9873157.1 hypothetical protein CkaCkLH20_09320 [Colletotrichum karsti]